MRAKRDKHGVFGAQLSCAEKKGMQMEIQRQIAEYDLKNKREIDAMILWQLHTQLGFGPERLKRFYKNFAAEYKALLARYEMDPGEGVWLCTHKLAELGIDLEALEKEV